MTKPQPAASSVPAPEPAHAHAGQPTAQPKPPRASGSEAATIVWKRAPGLFGYNPVPRD